jgi:hypothetical protein
MGLAVLAACGGQGQTPRAALPARAAIPASADVAGFAFGLANGALVVARAGQPLTNSDGLPAKRAALAYCAGQGGALNPAAFGRFVGTSWVFNGGCV